MRKISTLHKKIKNMEKFLKSTLISLISITILFFIGIFSIEYLKKSEATDNVQNSVYQESIDVEILNTDFPDVPEDHFANKYITELASRGIVEGYADGTFKPDEKITDLELLEMIFLSSNQEFNTIIKNNPWYADIIDIGRKKFLTNLEESWISPKENSIRAELVAYAMIEKGLILKYVDKEDYLLDIPENFVWEDYIKEAYYRGIISGVDHREFGPYENVTRAQAAKVIYNIFFEDEDFLREEFLTNKEINIMFTGDVMLARTVGTKIDQNGVNYPFEEIKDLLETPDFTYINLETSVTNEGQRIPKGIEFRAKPETLDGVKWAGIDQVCLANNHTGDYSDSGLTDTFMHLNERDIDYVGAGNNADEAYNYIIQEIGNNKVAFLCYNGIDPRMFEATSDSPGSAWVDDDRMREGINAARQIADLVFVSIHHGTEYTPNPNQAQIHYSRLAVDAGADAVISHHPHVVQAIEIYREKPILYSLGNLVFDQMWSIPTQQGLLANVTVKKGVIHQIDLTPVHIYDYAQPRVADENEAKQILQRIYDASIPFGDHPEILEGYLDV